MKTVRVRVKDQAYDQFLKSLDHFDHNDVEILHDSLNHENLSDFKGENFEPGNYGEDVNLQDWYSFLKMESNESTITNSLRKFITHIKQLSPEELLQARQWFHELDHHLWDMEIKNDSKSGKLDSIVQKGLDEYHRNQAKNL